MKQPEVAECWLLVSSVGGVSVAQRETVFVVVLYHECTDTLFKHLNFMPEKKCYSCVIHC